MARVTFIQYLDRRKELTWAWKNYQACFRQLSFLEQRHLHDYFRFIEDLTENELRDHWQKLNTLQSSLPQSAGRAYAALRHTHVYATARQHAKLMGKPVVSSPDATLHVEGLARPQPNYESLARLLLDIARKDRERGDFN